MRIHHHEHFFLTMRQAKREDPTQLNFTIPVEFPPPAQYLLKVVSERWMGATEIVPMAFEHLIPPQSAPPYTDMLPLIPLPVQALNNPEFCKIYKFTHFNPMQTQVFHTMYYTDSNALIGAPTGSGKTIAAEFAALRVFGQGEGQKVIYIAPLKALVKERLEDWQRRFEGKLGKKSC
eukprot:TRINITY_DN80747_c0_g1_i1.p1 TRINITY_DN80747_c0_g1~~TRINITY_DN80747_c0_g1_i1.p1  ORF type:complete len:192 (-),score=23.59 TRINITY_DN80747_c0_g1_i1:57-587(-)